MITDHAPASWRGATLQRPAWPLFPLQPMLAHIVRGVARRHPEMFARLGAHQRSRFIIDPIGLPFILYLRPHPKHPVLRAYDRRASPACDARITAPLLQLVDLIDGDGDGDALFFARDLVVSGDTEAIVSLRNAIDDMDGSLAASVASLFGPLGQGARKLLRRARRRVR